MDRPPERELALVPELAQQTGRPPGQVLALEQVPQTDLPLAPEY
jgi:hypothetical protein